MKLTQFERYGEKLADDLKDFWVGKKLTPENVNILGDDIRKFLVLSRRSATSIRQCLLRHIGSEVTEKKLKSVCRTVMLARDRVEKGRMLGESHVRSGTVEARCENVRLTDRVELSLRLLGGALANQLRKWTCSPRAFRGLAWRVGLKGRTPRIPHPRELFGFVFTIELQREGRDIEVKAVDVTDAQKRKNARLRLQRQRARCNLECYYCPTGLSSCDKATHLIDWEKRRCDEDDAVTYHNSRGCLLCQENEYLANGGQRPELL